MSRFHGVCNRVDVESDWLPCSINPLPEESPLAKVARCLAVGGEVWLACGSGQSCLLGEGHWNRAVQRILPLIQDQSASMEGWS